MAERVRLWAFSLGWAYVILGVILSVGQTLLLFPGVYRTPTHESLPEGSRRVYVQSPDASVCVIHSEARHDRVVVMSHGNNEFATDLLAYAQVLDASGWDWVSVEYRGYDGEPGWPSEDALADDFRAVLEWLPSQGWSKDRTIVHGRSMGGGVVVAGARDVDVAGFVLESTFDSIPAVAMRRFPLMLYPVQLLLRTRFDNTRLAERDVPVFQLHFLPDTVVPIAHARTLRASLSDVTWVERDGYPHGFPIVLASADLREAWLDWLEEVVPRRIAGVPPLGDMGHRPRPADRERGVEITEGPPR